MNGKDELNKAFRTQYGATEEELSESDAETLLGKIDTYLHMGWRSNAEVAIDELESEYDVDFTRMADETVSDYLHDPREEWDVRGP